MTPWRARHGRGGLDPGENAVERVARLARCLGESLARGSGHGIPQLGAADAGQVLTLLSLCWRL